VVVESTKEFLLSSIARGLGIQLETFKLEKLIFTIPSKYCWIKSTLEVSVTTLDGLATFSKNHSLGRITLEVFGLKT
jgi:hypothetical protein